MNDFNDNETVTISLKRYHDFAFKKNIENQDKLINSLAKMIYELINISSPHVSLILHLNKLCNLQDCRFNIKNNIIKDSIIEIGTSSKNIYKIDENGLIF